MVAGCASEPKLIACTSLLWSSVIKMCENWTQKLWWLMWWYFCLCSRAVPFSQGCSCACVGRRMLRTCSLLGRSPLMQRYLECKQREILCSQGKLLCHGWYLAHGLFCHSRLPALPVPVGWHQWRDSLRFLFTCSSS